MPHGLNLGQNAPKVCQIVKKVCQIGIFSISPTEIEFSGNNAAG